MTTAARCRATLLTIPTSSSPQDGHLLVVVGTVTALMKAARGVAPVGADPHQFLMIPLSDMAFFGGFIAAALLLRANCGRVSRSGPSA